MSGLSPRESLIINSVSDGISINSGGVFTFVNETFADMLGYTVSELIGMHIKDVTAPEYLDMILERSRKRQLGLDVESIYEIEVVRKDRSRVHVELSISRIEYEGKGSSLTIVRGITERVQERLDYIPVFETLSEAICIFDNEKFIWANDAYLKMRGYDSLNELVGKSILVNIHPDEQQDATRVVSDQTLKGRSSSGVWRVKNPDGSYQSMDIRTSVLPGQEKPLFMSIISGVESDDDELVRQVKKGDLINEINTALTLILGHMEILRDKDSLTKTELDSFFTVIDLNSKRIQEILDKIK